MVAWPAVYLRLDILAESAENEHTDESIDGTNFLDDTIVDAIRATVSSGCEPLPMKRSTEPPLMMRRVYRVFRNFSTFSRSLSAPQRLMFRREGN